MIRLTRHHLTLCSPQIPARTKTSPAACWFREGVRLPSRFPLSHPAAPFLSAAALMARSCSQAPPRPPCRRCPAGAHLGEFLRPKTTRRLARDLCDCPTPTGTVLPRSCPCRRAQTPATSWGGKTPTIAFLIHQNDYCHIISRVKLIYLTTV